jgi:23S rRNA (guanosine2251-2'-O)-methyltransferase
MQILYGYRSVIERLKKLHAENKINKYKLYITQIKFEEEKKKKSIIFYHKNITFTTTQELNNKCKSNYHNSVCLEIENLFTPVGLHDLNNYIIILDNVTDVGNIGSIIRSCGISQWDLILSRNNTGPINSITSKNAAGGLDYINIHICGSLLQTIQQLKKQNYFIVGATEKNSITENKINILSLSINKRPEKIVLIMGGENSGISLGIIKQLDFFISIPGNINFNVYNVSVAAALCMYLIKN